MGLGRLHSTFANVIVELPGAFPSDCWLNSSGYEGIYGGRSWQVPES
jgi:hypothetical protein